MSLKFGKISKALSIIDCGVGRIKPINKKNPDKKNPLIIIGRDGRLSSPSLYEKLNEGLENSGCEIYKIGLGPTPMLYFANCYFKADGAIQVTGSHNPKDYNGFKIVLNQDSFFGEDIQKLGHFASKGYSNTYHGFSKSVEINSKYNRSKLDIQNLKRKKTGKEFKKDIQERVQNFINKDRFIPEKREEFNIWLKEIGLAVTADIEVTGSNPRKSANNNYFFEKLRFN